MASLASHLVPWHRHQKPGLYWSSPSPWGLSSRVDPLHTAAQPREPVLQETGLGPEIDMVSFPLYSVG